MDTFNVKKLVKEAGSAISRIVQVTEEKLGISQKTELCSNFKDLAKYADATKQCTERILKSTEVVLTLNPGNPVDDYLFEKIDMKKPGQTSTVHRRRGRMTNLECLGNDMIAAGNVFGSCTTYGNALIKVGEGEKSIGTFERKFINNAEQYFVDPLHEFLEGEMKTISKEQSILEMRRLDLDACKNRVRKAKIMLETPTDAEQDLRKAQSEFDKQVEITRLLLEGVISCQASHLRCLHEFVTAQTQYFADCHQRMLELQKELADSADFKPIMRVLSEEIDLSSHNIIEVSLS